VPHLVQGPDLRRPRCDRRADHQGRHDPRHRQLRNGLVGRGVLLDIPRFRGVKWLEPGEAVTRVELEACEKAQGVELGEGDVFVFRTGITAAAGARRVGQQAGRPKAGQGRLHVDTVPWMHERHIAAFLPDGDGEAVPSTVEGMLYPIHPLQIAAMGMLASDSLQFEDLAKACEEEGRFESWSLGCHCGCRVHWLAVEPDRDFLVCASADGGCGSLGKRGAVEGQRRRGKEETERKDETDGLPMLARTYCGG